MFRPIAEAREGAIGAARLSFTFDGTPLTGRSGDTVAAALLANGIVACRETPVSDTPRAPYCLMGVCFDCLVVIDGIGNRQGCLVTLTEGMRIETQHGRRHLAEVGQ
ncbi:(2Fe-2S)-binding protein [Bosea sp. TAF32]|uniref:(2Fe-2S)-binding protein n=1 Tax=Bosea sp. TAF32 TaxID=3237482 RepID=UPI003F8E743B